ncbi:hypothetical protein OAO01_03245 [Oligoflexia bacterium]|nr:hypothetical protein [Oligoflexia bacterium]
MSDITENTEPYWLGACGRPLIGDGSFYEQLVVVTPDFLRKSTPEGLPAELNYQMKVCGEGEGVEIESY